jgi:hypothetical protein
MSAFLVSHSELTVLHLATIVLLPSLSYHVTLQAASNSFLFLTFALPATEWQNN